MPTKQTFRLMIFLAGILFGVACTRQTTPTSVANPTPAGSTSLQVESPPAVVIPNQGGAVIQLPVVTLDPSQGQAIGYVYEAFLSPHQEPGEEKDTPALVPNEFRATGPSLLRSERLSRGHGVLRFTNDLSKVYVEVQVEHVNPEEVVMFHIHCGRPDMLGPILVDFALMDDIQDNLADGLFSVEVTNADIEKTSLSGHGVIGAFTRGCPIIPGLADKVKTIAGMEYIARQGELYFNLHTKGQTFYGDIRGQLHSVIDPITGNAAP